MSIAIQCLNDNRDFKNEAASMFQLGKFQVKNAPPGFNTLIHSCIHFSDHLKYSSAFKLSSIWEGYNLFKLKGGSEKIKSTESHSMFFNISKQSPWYNLPSLVEKIGAGSTFFIISGFFSISVLFIICLRVL